jgi:hypothetical protein
MKKIANENLLKELVERFSINLSGLTIYTEAASGPYLFAPILAAFAGAKKVFAQTCDSRFSKANEVKSETIKVAKSFGLSNRIEVLTNRCHNSLSEADIVTNTGFVRPIDRDLISKLKQTAVIPLMWETWEFRPSDFDLEYCKAKEILVLGTNESRPPCDMSNFIGWTSIKLLFALDFDGGKVLVIGSKDVPASPIVNAMLSLGIDVTWVSKDKESNIHFENFREHFLNYGHTYAIMIIAEHRIPDLILGVGGILDYETIKLINNELKIGIICGNVDFVGLKESSLRFEPKHIAPFGFISYQPYIMGSRPVLTLYAAGLKVGEDMARARLRGLSVTDSAKYVLENKLAMDFEGNLSWI